MSTDAIMYDTWDRDNGNGWRPIRRNDSMFDPESPTTLIWIMYDKEKYERSGGYGAEPCMQVLGMSLSWKERV